MNLLPISHRQQIQQADCLAACAAMILDYLHIPIQYKYLLNLLKVRSFGTSLFNLHNLQTLGLFVLIEEGDMAVLQAHLNTGLPPIVAVSTAQLSYWTEDTDHAIVVVGIDEDFVYLHDPDRPTAPQKVSIKEFESAWLDQDYWYAVVGLDEIDKR